jgi:hypothetical protein
MTLKTALRSMAALYVTITVSVVVFGAMCFTAGRWTAPEAHCPTEDSCAIDYRDGAWTITEVTP